MTDTENLSAEDRRLAAWLASAPLPPASPAFCDRVMRAIEGRPLPWGARWRRFLFAPRRLQWNVAGLTAAAFALVMAVGAGWVLLRPAGGPVLHAGSSGQNVVVRFEYRDPGARAVALAGDFSQWQARIPLRKRADGIWVAEVPLTPGNYEYMFVVDGERWVADPRAARHRPDGFGNHNALLTVSSYI